MGIRNQNSNVNQSPQVPKFHKIVALELSRHASDSSNYEEQLSSKTKENHSTYESTWIWKQNLAAENTVQREPVQLT
jgi:hypothetical protein